MRQVSPNVASDLLSSIYAHHSGFSYATIPQIRFLPSDHVYARFAVALIDKQWSSKFYILGIRISGKGQSSWVEQAVRVFSGGFCRPDKSVSPVALALASHTGRPLIDHHSGRVLFVLLCVILQYRSEADSDANTLDTGRVKAVSMRRLVVSPVTKDALTDV
jgi:hypothetical protein